LPIDQTAYGGLSRRRNPPLVDQKLAGYAFG
jgi:hypothetical protein